MKRVWQLIRFVTNHPLNQCGRFAAVKRLVQWQIGSRLLPQGALLPFVNGTNLYVTHGMTGATGNWYCGLHEAEDMGFLLHALRPDDLFVDVGANIGSYTILAAGAVGADVVAVEPVPSTFSALRRNVILNDLSDRVRCLNAGVSDSAGELLFTSGQDTTNHVVAEGEQADAVSVRVLPLDEICDERVPAILKVDVEGYEHAVVAGGARTFSDPTLQAVIMETNGSGARYGWDDSELVNAMCKFGFSTCIYDPLCRRLEAASPGTGNTLFVRNVEAIRSRVAAAPKFQLVNGII